MDETKLKDNISRNITTYRKRCNLTQAQLADKISYSDKAVSKWERGDGLPDIMVLMNFCEIFNVTLNDLVADKPKKQAPFFLRNRVIITILSCLIAWLVGVFCYAICNMVLQKTNTWMVFIYTLSVTFIILVVFSCIWGKKIIKFIAITGLIWTTLLSFYLSFEIFADIYNAWMIFLIGIPIQLAFIFFFLIKKKDI